MQDTQSSGASRTHIESEEGAAPCGGVAAHCGKLSECDNTHKSDKNEDE